MNIQTVDARLLEGRLSSKQDWYTFLKYHKGFCMPSYKNTTMRFIRDYLQGAKFLIKQKDINKINVPHYPELKIESILNQVKSDAQLMNHLNYYDDQKQLPEREFFFNIVGTLAPQYLENLVIGQNRIRNVVDAGHTQEQAIAIRDDIFKEIQSVPFFSKARGKGSAMLKVQAKAKRQQLKKRKQYELQQQFIKPTNVEMEQLEVLDNEEVKTNNQKKFKFNI